MLIFPEHLLGPDITMRREVVDEAFRRDTLSQRPLLRPCYEYIKKAACNSAQGYQGAGKGERGIVRALWDNKIKCANSGKSLGYIRCVLYQNLCMCISIYFCL